MKYYLFIDESGDHGLGNIDPNFPVFVLCGIVISEIEYENLRTNFNNIKTTFWNNINVIFHSRDIRKCNNEFEILFDNSIKGNFYKSINNAISCNNYCIISSVVNKLEHIKKYGKLAKDVYEIALSFIIERTIFYLDDFKNNDISLDIILEKRGNKEDLLLSSHFQRLQRLGTGYVIPQRLKNYNCKIDFKDKKENINGLQIADLIAYPIARYSMNPEGVNLSYEIFKSKFYTKNGKNYGLKIFP